MVKTCHHKYFFVYLEVSWMYIFQLMLQNKMKNLHQYIYFNAV